jgi:hypothetical protein
MFDVQDGGVSSPIKWGKQNLQPDNIVIVLDEDNMCVWLWHGKNRSLISRRTALRQAESLKGHGYQNGKSIVGRGMQKIVEIDERKIDRDPETTSDNQKFVELLSRQVTEVNDFIVFFGVGGPELPSERQSQPKPEVKVEAPAVPPQPRPVIEQPKVVIEQPKIAIEHPKFVVEQPKPEPKVVVQAPVHPVHVEQPKVMQAVQIPAVDVKKTVNESASNADEYEENDIPAPPMKAIERVKEKPKCEGEALEQSEMGLVIISVLSQFKDVWVSRKDDGTISIEQMDGPVCKFNISDGKVKFAAGAFQDIDPNIKAMIQKKFIDLVTACGLGSR